MTQMGSINRSIQSMDNSLKTSRLVIHPQLLAVLSVFVICIIPIILNLFGIDFTSRATPLSAVKMSSGEVKPDDLFYAVAGGLHHALMEWSAVTIAVLAALASFIHYSIKKDITVPIIGMALLSAGMVDAFHTLAATRIVEANAPNTDFIPFTWAISRIFNAGIMIVGVLVSMWIVQRPGQLQNSQRMYPIYIIGALFLGLAYTVVLEAAISSDLPKTMY